MSEIPNWVERKFDFSVPAELYANLRVRLGGAPPRLEELTHGLARTALIHRPDGKWSIQEHAGHLYDLEELWYRRMEELIGGAETLTAADMGNAKTHQAGHNERPLDDVLAAFRRARARLVERLEGLEPADFHRTALHPRLRAPMRLADLIYFVAEHDDHHLARIREIRRLLKA